MFSSLWQLIRKYLLFLINDGLNKLSGQALHAKTLEFIHPTTKKRMSFNSNLPNGFKKILNLLENLSGWNNQFYL